MDQVNDEILEILEKELSRYKDTITDELQAYNDFPNLDCEELHKKGFKYQGDKKGTVFIDQLRDFLHKKDIDISTSFWIVNKWGGIESFRHNERNQNRIGKFEMELVKFKLTNDIFSVISSLSKIASFKNYEDYFVYDSRVIYTLNWLILKNNLINPKFFPMPESRSSKLTLFELNTLINLTFKESIEDKDFRQNLYFNKDSAYFIYCNLIKELNKRLFPDIKPYYLEMLLFALADKHIFDDLKSSVRISIY